MSFWKKLLFGAPKMPRPISEIDAAAQTMGVGDSFSAFVPCVLRLNLDHQKRVLESLNEETFLRTTAGLDVVIESAKQLGFGDELAFAFTISTQLSYAQRIGLAGCLLEILEGNAITRKILMGERA